MHIIIDLDGTIFTQSYPEIGKIKRNAKSVINKWYDNGHTIIINTCRTKDAEDKAIEALNNNGIKYHYINENSEERINIFKENCRKISGDIHIDDKNINSSIVAWSCIEKFVDNMLTHKPIIFCIVGESGSGKTTIAEYIEKEYDIPMIQSYTDRPPRYKGENGHTFLTVEEYNKLKECDMITNTVFGNYRYCCLKKDVKPFNTYVIDESGLIKLKQNKDYKIISVLVSRPIEERKKYVSNERLERDKGNFGKIMDYNYFLNNFYNLEELYDEVDSILSHYLNKDGYNVRHIARDVK